VLHKRISVDEVIEQRCRLLRCMSLFLAHLGRTVHPPARLLSAVLLPHLLYNRRGR